MVKVRVIGGGAVPVRTQPRGVRVQVAHQSTVVDGDFVSYTGQYNVRPGFVAQRLETIGKVMIANVTVEPIPVTREPNGSGTAVRIGG